MQETRYAGVVEISKVIFPQWQEPLIILGLFRVLEVSAVRPDSSIFGIVRAVFGDLGVPKLVEHFDFQFLPDGGEFWWDVAHADGFAEVDGVAA